MSSTAFPAGRVYKIVNSVDSLVYVGSTTQTLAKRMTTHRNNAKLGKPELVYYHMRELGISKFEIFLLQETAAITREALRALEHKWICELDTVKNGLNGRYESQICEHEKCRAKCKDCIGSAICEHGRQRTTCKECGGSQICEHQKQRQQCKECGGSQICEHQRERARCKECGGSQICEHQKQRQQCKECAGSQICEHQKRRQECIECNPCRYCGVTNTSRHRVTLKHIINFIQY